MAAHLSRRELLTGTALAAALAASDPRQMALASVAAVPERRQDRVLVTLFLRGGADGLSIVPPVADPEYHRLRPTLSLASPQDRSAPRAARAIPLDDYFGLNPALRSIERLYRDGLLAVLHAVGSGDRTRSHFEAMAVMERGLAGSTEGPSGGWLARAVTADDEGGVSPLRALAFTETMPDILRGASGATVIRSLTDFRLHGNLETARTLQALYGMDPAGDDDLGLLQAGRGSLRVMDAIAALHPAAYQPSGGAVYPPGPLGDGLRQTACLIKGRLGLEAAFLDATGWDTHVAQGRDSGWLPARLAELGQGLDAFTRDLGAEIGRVTGVVMTEFGRRAYENSGLGTDHGRGSCMFLFGAGVAGGRVHAAWPGLAPRALEPPGDLAVTTDYRRPLYEAVRRTLGATAAAAAFPGYTHTPIGVVSA